MIGPADFTDHYSGHKRPQQQFATVLTVQRESPPQWYLHCSLVHGPSDFIWPVSAWPEYVGQHILQAAEILIPDIHRREFWRDVYDHCVVYRAALRPEEVALLPVEAVIETWQ